MIAPNNNHATTRTRTRTTTRARHTDNQHGHYWIQCVCLRCSKGPAPLTRAPIVTLDVTRRRPLSPLYSTALVSSQLDCQPPKLQPDHNQTTTRLQPDYARHPNQNPSTEIGPNMCVCPISTTAYRQHFRFYLGAISREASFHLWLCFSLVISNQLFCSFCGCFLAP